MAKFFPCYDVLCTWHGPNQQLDVTRQKLMSRTQSQAGCFRYLVGRNDDMAASGRMCSGLSITLLWP